MVLPEPIQRLIDAFSRLPGVGPKTASRLAFHVLRSPDELSSELSQALATIKSDIVFCQRCFNITTAGRDLCQICSDERRDQQLICIVEEPLDVIALERTEAFDGVYHVLDGTLSPIEGIGPEDLKIQELMLRVADGEIREIIIATNPSMEGDATAMFLQGQLKDLVARVTRLARGLPVGGDLEYADQNTLQRALSGRQEME